MPEWCGSSLAHKGCKYAGDRVGERPTCAAPDIKRAACCYWSSNAAFIDFRNDQIRKICDSVYGRPIAKFSDEIGC